MFQTRSAYGMRIFTIIWFGQLISTLGSGLTGFALGVWVYEKTGSVTLFAANMLAFALPNLLLAPLAGALVDRWDRRWVMVLSDTGAALSTLAVILLVLTGKLQVWHIYLVTAVGASLSAFQWPAYSAATTLLVPKEQLGRAGGMVQIGEAVSQLVSPAVAGALYVTTGLQGVAMIDFATFLFAVTTLLLVNIPQPEISVEGKASRGSLLSEGGYGWKYILARPGLLGLLLIFAAHNFLTGLSFPLIAPMVLDMTSPEIFGLLSSLAGLGMLAGTLVMSIWGGPRRRIHGVLAFLGASGTMLVLFGLTPYIVVMTSAGFGLMFASPIINGSSQAIWQSKVAPDVQGRVFSVRRMIAWSTTPLAYVLAGPLADKLFTPLLMPDGLLADSVGQVIGVGPGRGIGLLFIVIGISSSLVALSGYLNPHVRNLEDELPDAISREILVASGEPAPTAGD